MKSQKKIFRLFSRLNVGGPSLHVVNLAVGLDEHGYDTTLIIGTPETSEGSMEDYAVQSGAKLLWIKSFQATISPFKDLSTFFSLIYLFWKEKPDIVHTHTFKAGLLGRLAAFITRVPVVVHTYHGHLLNGYASPFKVRILVWIEKLLALGTDHLLTVSSRVSTDLTMAGVARKEKMSVVELGFDMKRLLAEVGSPPSLRKDLGISESARVVGIVSRLVPIKSIDLFLRALGPLTQTEKDFHLVIIGDGSEREVLKRLARIYDPKFERIHFCGWRMPASRDYRDLDVCVCSSKNEGTSVSIIEALVAGVPVVSTNVGGMSDLLEGGRWGNLVGYDEVELRNGVLKALANPQTKLQAETASRIFRYRFSNERLVKDVAAIYERFEREV